MKFYQIIFILAITVIGMTSCEEVIVLDLKNDEPRIVIDAVVDVNTKTAAVFLTMSNGFYDDIALEVINDATIQLTQADGNIVDLQRVADGAYTAFGLEANEGDELSIVVIDGNGTEYKASTYVPHHVSIDSLGVIESSGGPGGGNPFGGGSDLQNYQIFTYWQDEANKESFYRIRAAVNDTLQTNFNLADDFQQEGEQIFRPFFSQFQSGDTVRIELMSIDEASFKYFSDLSAIQGQGPGGGGTTPFNPKSNFDNDALGYFGIVNRDTETLILQ